MPNRITLGEVMRALLVDPDLPTEEGGPPLRQIAGIDPDLALVWPPCRADPAGVADLAYREFCLSGLGCGYSVFAALVKTYATWHGAPYNLFPLPLLKHRRGRYSGAGKVCGALIGAEAAISLFWSGEKRALLLEELCRWYREADLPLYAPLASVLAECGVKALDMVMPRSTSGSTHCSASQLSWVRACDFPAQDKEKKERCGRLSADVAAKAMEILNNAA